MAGCYFFILGCQSLTDCYLLRQINQINCGFDNLYISMIQFKTLKFINACNSIQLMEEKNNTIWTIGHSTRPLEEFIAMLYSFSIELVADIRSFPGSRKFPQFNKEALEVFLPQNNIRYVHLKSLGGRRKVMSDSKNTGWRHAAFRGYADYMETERRSTSIHIPGKNCKRSVEL
jgi:hypothetical protein